MTFRSCGRDTVPMIGPRSRALAAPQAIGKLSLAPGAGCEVMRIWSTRFDRVIAGPLNGDGPPEQTGLIINDELCSGTSRPWKYKQIATQYNAIRSLDH